MNMAIKEDILDAIAKKDLSTFVALMKKLDEQIEYGEDSDIEVVRELAYSKADESELFLLSIGEVEKCAKIVNRAIKSGNVATMEGAFSSIDACKIDVEKALPDKISAGIVTDDDIKSTDNVLEKLRRLEDMLTDEIVKYEKVDTIHRDVVIKRSLDRMTIPEECAVCGRAVDKKTGIYYEGKWYHPTCFEKREKAEVHKEYCSICGKVILPEEVGEYLPTGDPVHTDCRKERGL